MFYFVPAWYSDWRPWYDTTVPFYERSPFAHFDDTINQLRMFEYAGQDNKLLVLNYMPNLRYFVHKYDLLEVPVWSLFDEIQGLNVSRQRQLDFKALNWPRGAEFIHTPFAAIVHWKGQRYATIDFGEDGQMIWVTYFEDGQVSRRYIFDDRGFTSSILYFENGIQHHQDYLDTAGVWQIREYLLPEDRHVEVSEVAHHRFTKERYDNIEELVAERVTAYLAEREATAKDDCLIVASHPCHNDLLLSLKGQRRLILSYYQQRYPLDRQQEILVHAAASDLMVVDTLAGTAQLAGYGLTALEHLSPFDTRLTLGKSQRLKEQIICLLIDGLDDEILSEYLADIFVFMEMRDDVNISLVSYENSSRREFLEELIAEQDKPYLYFETEEERKKRKQQQQQLDPLEEPKVEPRSSFDYLGTESAIQQHLENVRMIVDLREYPDLYTQIAGISAGIPQVNSKESEFVEHLKNGYIATEPADLFIAMDHYLGTLSNWNKSLVYAVQKIDDYTSGRLVNRLLTSMEKHG